MEPEKEGEYKVRNLRGGTSQQIGRIQMSRMVGRRKDCQRNGDFQEEGRGKGSTEGILYFK